MGLSTEEILIYIGGALAVILVGIFLYRKEILFLLRKKETKGVIVNWMAANEKGKKYFHPMIEFEPEGSSRVTFRADERCEGEPLYAPGTVVTIKYLPGDITFRKVIYP